jgi:ankyrin repeat protein
MKELFLGIILFFSGVANAQNLKKIIDKNDVIAFQNYIDDGGKFEEMIPILVQNNELVQIHPFVYAVKNERLRITKLFVEYETVFDDFETQLSIAFIASISNSNTEITNFLFDKKPNINQVSEIHHGYNALMFAVVNGKEDLFFKLEAKSDFNVLSDEGNNLFHLIGENLNSYNSKILTHLILNKSLDINLINNYGRTPLDYAARIGNSELFFELIKNGAKPKELNYLHTDAVIGGEVKIFKYVKELIKGDPNWTKYPEMIDETGNTFYGLEQAIKNNNTEVTKFIFDEMFLEVKNVKQDDQIEILAKILNSRQLENDQFWPLWEVMQSENKELFEFLVRSMVQFNKLKIEYTAYNSFVEGDYTEIAEVLFTKFEYRSAKRRFGKEYVTNLYNELGVNF